MSNQKQLAAARLKLAKQAHKENKDSRPQLAGAFTDHDKQIICNGYFMTIHNDIIEGLPQADTSRNIFAYTHIIPKHIKSDFLPVVYDLTQTNDTHKNICFNGVAVNLQLFVDVGASLINPQVYANKTSTKAPLYIEAENGIAIIMPLRAEFAESEKDFTCVFGTSALIDGVAEAEERAKQAIEEAERKRQKDERIKAYEQDRAAKRQAAKDKTKTEVNAADELVKRAKADTSDKIYSLSAFSVTLYGDSEYTDKEINIIEAFAKRSGVVLPLKLIGWIRSKLHSIEFKNGKFYSYKFFRVNGSRQSSTLADYCRLIFDDKDEQAEAEQAAQKVAEENNRQKLALLPKNLQKVIRYYAHDPKIKDYEIRFDDRVEHRNNIITVTSWIFKYKEEFYTINPTEGRGGSVLNVSIKWFDADAYINDYIAAGSPWTKTETYNKLLEVMTNDN